MDEQKLLSLKKKIERAKSTISELKGEQKSLKKQLKDQFQCNSVGEGEKKLNVLESEIESTEEDIKEKTKELTEKYPALNE